MQTLPLPPPHLVPFSRRMEHGTKNEECMFVQKQFFFQFIYIFIQCYISNPHICTSVHRYIGICSIHLGKGQKGSHQRSNVKLYHSCLILSAPCASYGKCCSNVPGVIRCPQSQLVLSYSHAPLPPPSVWTRRRGSVAPARRGTWETAPLVWVCDAQDSTILPHEEFIHS